MDTFIPRDKMSKKQKKELDKQKRGNWGAITPTTRVVRDRKKYDRNSVKNAERKNRNE